VVSVAETEFIAPPPSPLRDPVNSTAGASGAYISAGSNFGNHNARSVIDKVRYGTEFKLVHQLHVENSNLIHKDLNTSVDELDN
jgi:hypothetical protein